jgi:uncharacterized protein (TIGR03663 family)
MNATTSESACAKPTCSEKYFTCGEFLFYVALVVAGLCLRWFTLETRPFHHDESLHGMYGKYFFDFPDANYYRYQALLHGPFLYNLYRIVFNTLGQGDWASRVPIAMVGSLFIFLPIIFRQYFSKSAVLGLTAAVALSPTLVYWSRFLREDTLIVGCMMLMLYGVTLATGPRKALIVLLSLSLQFCIKENAYVTVAILVGYLCFELIFAGVVLGSKECLLRTLGGHLKAYALAVLNAAAIAVFVYCYLYSAGFRYWKGVLDGLYRESLGYWIHQHSIDRITGPFLFHFYTLSWYEFGFIVAFFCYLWTFYRRAAAWAQNIGMAFLLVAISLSFWVSANSINDFPYASTLKLKDSLDVLGFFILVPQSVITTVVHLLRRERRLAFFGYLFLANFCTYSYLGEKVPWLTVYPFIAGLVYFALYFDDYFQRYPIQNWTRFPVAKAIRVLGIVCVVLGIIFMYEEGDSDGLYWIGFGLAFIGASFSLRAAGVLGSFNLQHGLLALFCVYTLRSAVLTNFVYPGEAREYISQVHTTPEFHEIANQIKHEIFSETRGFKPQVLVMGEATWPMTWYMRDIPEYKFQATPQEYQKFDYIIRDWKENEKPEPANFLAQRINLRGWWVPDFRQMTLKKFLGYALNQTPWSSVGYSYVWLLVNPTAPDKRTPP